MRNAGALPPGGWGVFRDAMGDSWVIDMPWAVRYRNRLGRSDHVLLYKVSAEFADSS